MGTVRKLLVQLWLLPMALALLPAACQGAEPTASLAPTSAPIPTTAPATVHTPTPEPTATSTAVPTILLTSTSAPTSTSHPSPPPHTPLQTPTSTPSPTATPTPSLAPTLAHTPTATVVPTLAPTSTPTPTPAPTPTPTPSPAPTPTLAPIPTPTDSPVPMPTSLSPTPTPPAFSTHCPKSKRTAASTQRSALGTEGLYDGPLFDTHAHRSPTIDSLDVLFDLMDKDQVEWMIMYYGVAHHSLVRGQYYSGIKDYVENAQCRIIFLLAHGRGEAFANGLYDETFLNQRLQPQGLFHGVGEIRLYLGPLQPLSYEGFQMQTVFRSVNAMQGVVMIHPRDGTRDSVWRAEDSAELARAFRTYPNITFLFHGHATSLEQHILTLMSEYPNVYYTFDVAHMVHTHPARIEHRKSDRPDYTSPDYADWWTAVVDEIGGDRIVADSVSRTRPWFLRHPDRIVWGTDRLRHQWNQPASDMMMRISRQFIAELPADVREAYAYKNALRVFGKYLVPPQ